jgi:hypothetical protein
MRQRRAISRMTSARAVKPLFSTFGRSLFINATHSLWDLWLDRHVVLALRLVPRFGVSRSLTNASPRRACNASASPSVWRPRARSAPASMSREKGDVITWEEYSPEEFSSVNFVCSLSDHLEFSLHDLLTMSTRVGELNNPALYGSRKLSVYSKRNGSLYFILDGRREPLHGNHRWTRTSGVQMKGKSLFTPSHDVSESDFSYSDEDPWPESDMAREEQDQIEMAIAASMEDQGGAHDGVAQDTASAEPEDEETTTASSSTRACSICLQDSSATMICRPCNHLVRRAGARTHTSTPLYLLLTCELYD